MLSDNELLTMLKDRPGKGLDKLMKRYTGFVYAIVSGKCSGFCTKEDIEECVSEVFFELFRNRDNIDPKTGSIKAFIAIIAKRRAIDLFRKCKRTVPTVSIDHADHEFEPGFEKLASGDDTEKTICDIESAADLIEKIKALGEPDSQIIIRKYYFGQSTKMIAKAIGLRENTVDKKASRALQKLRTILGGEL